MSSGRDGKRESSERIRTFFLPWSISLLCGIGAVFYRGPGWHFIRGTVGDVVAVAFLYFTISLFWNTAISRRVLIVAVIAILIEGAQLLHLTPRENSFASSIVLGSSFDPIDLIAYAVGLFFAVAVEKWKG